jgi:hypothetical protein
MRLALLIILAVLGFTSGGWMLFDGGRRLIAGDYVRINGQLGPWQHAFAAVGVDPMSAGVAVAFVVIALFRLAATVGVIGGARWGWGAMLASSVAILWYLPIGTANAILTIVILLLPALRAGGAS